MASIEEAKEIIKGTSISTIVGYYHPISKKGANFEGICPFHGDTQPSLKINDSKGIYKCFACGAAGDSIKFVQDKLNLDFIGAIKDISENLGITIDEQKKKDPKFDMALRVLQVASKLYRKVANEVGPDNFHNFLKQRNLNEESVKDFQIGYAPSGNALVNYLNSIPSGEKDKAIQVAKQIGLIRDNKRGQGHYDFYRERVIFPIWDHSGKVRGFSSRAVLPDQKPKYLNSGESFIFDKGNTMYGFNIAKSHIREQDSVVIVEGNMDVISLHQFGFKNSVATMGVALSNNSVRLLGNMTKNIYLGMDSDPAGIKAMTRINEEFLEQGLNPKFINFEPAKDPDEFLNEFGRLELAKRIEEAPTFLDFLIEREIPESIPENTDHKLDILNKIFGILAPLKSSLLANEKVIQCAKSLGLKSTNEDIIAEFKNYLANLQSQSTKKFKKPQAKSNNQNRPQQQNSQQNQPHNAAPHPKYDGPPPMDGPPEYMMGDMDGGFSGPMPEGMPGPMPEAMGQSMVPTTKVGKGERVLLETLITHPECVNHDQITEILDLIEHFEVKRIVLWLKKIYLEIDEAEYPLFVQEKMKEGMPDEIKSILASSLFNHNTTKLNEKVIDKMLSDLTLKLNVEALKSERDSLKQKQKQALSDEDSLVILNEIQEINIKLNELRNK